MPFLSGDPTFESSKLLMKVRKPNGNLPVDVSIRDMDKFSGFITGFRQCRNRNPKTKTNEPVISLVLESRFDCPDNSLTRTIADSKKCRLKNNQIVSFGVEIAHDEFGCLTYPKINTRVKNRKIGNRDNSIIGVSGANDIYKTPYTALKTFLPVFVHSEEGVLWFEIPSNYEKQNGINIRLASANMVTNEISYKFDILEKIFQCQIGSSSIFTPKTQNENFGCF